MQTFYVTMHGYYLILKLNDELFLSDTISLNYLLIVEFYQTLLIFQIHLINFSKIMNLRYNPFYSHKIISLHYIHSFFFI